jgi:transposase
MSIRKISRFLNHSRKAVRRVLRGTPTHKNKGTGYSDLIPVIDEQLKRCNGNAVRVQEELKALYHTDIPYSSLTRVIREMALREKERSKRSGEYEFGPGEEMQHDSSPHQVNIDGKRIDAQCAGLILAYSWKIYIQYYPKFTRFEAKVFLDGGFRYFDGVCPVCVIDNTSVILAGGAGKNAVISPEMKAFGDYHGVAFDAHEINHADRKGRIERTFRYVEGNFLAGRKFSNWADLNKKALLWCENIANEKPKRSLNGMTPEMVYLMEKRHLKKLPVYLPPVYETRHCIVDMSGYVTVDTNRYSVPERLVGRTVEVHKGWAFIRVYYKRKQVALHSRLIDKRNARVKAPGHHPPLSARKSVPLKEVVALTGQSVILDRYVDAMKKHVRGRGARKFKQLLDLKRTYPLKAFEKAVQTALHYGLFDLNRLERMILSNVAGDFFDLEEL